MSERERSLLVWILASSACLVGVLPTAVLGLSMPGEVVLPMSFALGALFAAVTASWAGNVLFAGGHRHRSRSRLLPVVGVTVVSAVVAVGLLLSLFVFAGPLLALLGALAGLTLMSLLLASAGLIALGATVAAKRFRTQESHLLRDAAASLVLVVLWPLAFYGGVEGLSRAAVVSCA